MADDTIRQSQVVGVFGPGAMLDLPERSVVVGGLDRWDMRAPGAFKPIEERRLSELLLQRLVDDPRWNKDHPPQLRTPPIDPNSFTGTKPAIISPIFPEWFVCDTVEGDTPGRRRLVRLSDLRLPARKDHEADDGRKRRVSPVRFVCGCTKGHLQDIEWRRILHEGGGSCREQMWLVDSGTSADPRDTRVVCDCGASLTLEDLFQSGRLGSCRGERPWIGDQDPTPCDAPKRLQLLTRSATNTYFPQVATVISLPEAEDTLARHVQAHWSDLRKCSSPEMVGMARLFNQAISAALAGYDDADVFARIQAMAGAADSTPAARNPRIAEFSLLANGRALIGENAPDALLHAETLDRSAWDPDGALPQIDRLVAVHRLREVSCLYGFTRFEPAVLASDELEDVGLAVEGAPLGQHFDWLPAIEQFGEGFFLTFDPRHLADWLSRPALRHRADQLAEGVRQWERLRHARGLRGDRKELGEKLRPDYIMAHGFAHTLMTEVALDCGYPASALKERVYVLPGAPEEPAAVGILIYTASAGTQGTLGGLVEVTRHFPALVATALERLRLCSGDPVCADHVPVNADEDRTLHGAACHACLLVAETSCEARNLFLDRALLVDTIGTTGSGYFE